MSIDKDKDKEYYNELGANELDEYINDKYSKDKETRKFIITQNNPQNYGLAEPADVLERLQGITYKYACFCYEKAPTTGTLHFHLYIDFGTPRGYKTAHNMFPHADIRGAKGSASQIRDYITKTGKHSRSASAETNLRETFRELGDFDAQHGRATRRNEKVLTELKAGRAVLDIIEDMPELIFKERQLSELAEQLRIQKVPDFRDVEVIYICGETGLGKTRMIHEENNPTEICSITSYQKHGDVKFDAYSGHKVLVFEEFRSQVDISSMLTYLDGYRINLPARYNDRVSAYDKVYITSNWSLQEQYKDIQLESPKTWRAFIRRIDKVVVFTGYRKYTEYMITTDKNGDLVYTEIQNIEGDYYDRLV